MSDQRLARALRRYALDAHGKLPDDVAVMLWFDGKAHQVPLSRRELSIIATGPAGAAAVEVIDALDIGETLSGEEIAERAGYVYGSWFAKLLTHLARDGTVCCFKRRGFGRNPS